MGRREQRFHGDRERGASAGAVAAALKHTLPEERGELTQVPLGELEAAGPQGGGGGGQQHLEQLPQVALEGQQTAQGSGVRGRGPAAALTSRWLRRSATIRSSLFPNSFFGGNSSAASWGGGGEHRSEVRGHGSGRPPAAAHLRILQLQALVHLPEAAVASEHRPHVLLHADLRTAADGRGERGVREGWTRDGRGVREERTRGERGVRESCCLTFTSNWKCSSLPCPRRK